jgi:inhibitor of KinA sporulation pathway (predicted exonuclease)
MEGTQIIKPILLGNLSHLEKTRSNEINNIFFDELNKMDLQTTLTMSFTAFLESISINNDTYINALKVKLKNQQSFYKDLVKTHKQTHLVFMLEIFGKQI